MHNLNSDVTKNREFFDARLHQNRYLKVSGKDLPTYMALSRRKSSMRWEKGISPDVAIANK